MWTPLVCEDKSYLFKINYSNEICVCLTDMRELWREVLTEEGFLKRFKVCCVAGQCFRVALSVNFQDSNPQFEPTVGEAVNFFETDTSVSDILMRNDEVTCDFNGYVGELKVKYQFNLKKATVDVVRVVNVLNLYKS